MPKTREEKQVIIDDLKKTLSESQVVLVIDYQGLKVAEISNLRDRIRDKGAVCTVAKNTLMGKAIEGDSTWQAMEEFLKGASAFLFLKEDFSVIKDYEEFQKVTKKTELRGGVMEGRALNEEAIKAITELPTKEELMAKIAFTLNASATRLAKGIKAVPTKLAVGIDGVPRKLARAIKAVSEKDGAQDG